MHRSPFQLPHLGAVPGSPSARSLISARSIWTDGFSCFGVQSASVWGAQPGLIDAACARRAASSAAPVSLAIFE